MAKGTCKSTAIKDLHTFYPSIQDKEQFHVTFGQGQLFGFGHHYYIEVWAKSEYVARVVLNSNFSNKWSMLYGPKRDWQPRYGEKCLGVMIIFDQDSWSVHRSI